MSDFRRLFEESKDDVELALLRSAVLDDTSPPPRVRARITEAVALELASKAAAASGPIPAHPSALGPKGALGAKAAAAGAKAAASVGAQGAMGTIVAWLGLGVAVGVGASSVTMLAGHRADRSLDVAVTLVPSDSEVRGASHTPGPVPGEPVLVDRGSTESLGVAPPAAAGKPGTAMPSARPPARPSWPLGPSGAAPDGVFAGRRGVAEAKGTANSLYSEIALLDRARDALRQGRAEQARAALEQHGRDCRPAGLAPEAELLWIRLLLVEGHREEARGRADRLLSQAPSPPYRAAVERLLPELKMHP